MNRGSDSGATPPPRVSHSLGWLTELQNMLYSVFPVCHEQCKPQNSHREEPLGTHGVGEVGGFLPSPGAPPPGPEVLTSSKAP